MFDHDCKESRDNLIKIEDFEFEVILELIRFIYTGQVHNIERIAKKLLIAADKYDIDDLKSRCETYLCRLISLHTVLDIMTLAHLYRVKDLGDKALQFFMCHKQDIVKSNNFLDKLKEMDIDLIALIITNLSIA
ncbi:hypothetical protein QAD02_019071 [Eretmocerus hayati]|uniref:Uncharacterized protein n=1 Tax=Eretmocerus hayati TaxID=131215 RepID=A0ACC2PJ01_9HYME|nr:hypothetical protein QAD02_019071 [Eretmocerus hayati]